MKFEINIDLEEIFADEEGVTVQQAIKEEILNRVVDKVQRQVGSAFKENVNKIISEEIRARMKVEFETLVPVILNTEFEEISSYGEKRGKWTIHSRIVDYVKQQCTLKDGNWNSDRNEFTSAIKSAAETQFKQFKEDFNKLADGMFTASAMEYAQTKLRDKLGIK